MPRNAYVDEHIKELSKRQTPYEKTVGGVNLKIEHGVYPTGAIGELFYKALFDPQYGIKPNQVVLDYGTGTGYLAIQAAKLGTNVVATDINPAAIKCAAFNIKLNGVDTRIELRQQDSFEHMNREKFDCILTGCPWDEAKPNPEVPLELSVYDENFKMRRALFKEGKKHLIDNGHILFSYSKRAQQAEPIENFISSEGYKHEIQVETLIDNDPHYIYRIFPKR